VLDEQGKIVLAPKPSILIVGGASTALTGILPKRQIYIGLDLNNHLASAKAGIYKVYACRRIVETTTNFTSWKPDPKIKGVQCPPFPTNFTNLQSGVLTIKLVDP
jgi:hypothetical protein